jgi:RNA polymerase sigma-70 factor (ECF subfamily)
MSTSLNIDKGLIWQVKNKDQVAFLKLYDQTITDVSRLVAYLLDDPTGLEDVIQEIYIAVYNALPKFDTDKPFRPWLMRIVIRQVKAQRRKNWRFARIKASLTRSIHRQYELDVAERVADNLQGEAILLAIRSLSTKLKTVIVLSYLHEYSRDEIASILGIPPGTVASRLRLALERLRRKHGNQLSEGEVEEYGL